MIFSDKIADLVARPLERGLCFGMDPVSIAAIGSLALGALGTGASAIGQGQQAAAQAGQANYMAQVARNNQIIAQRNATLDQQQGQVQEDRQRLKTAQLLGSQRAALAAQGGDVNAGSDLDILGDTARAGESDAQTIHYNAMLQAYGHQLEAGAAGGQANLYSTNAANTMANLPFGIGSSLLGGASSLSGRWAGYRNSGLL
jgi:TolA-binding protein